MDITKKLPVGIEDFEKIQTEDFYYVDKTGLIKELLQNWGEVNLFTRPRRFGKSLNMNMLKYFFEYGCDSKLFEGLEIAGEQMLCEKYMGRFPVISISLKDVGFMNYRTARAMLCSVIGNEAMRFQNLLESIKLSDREKAQYEKLINIGRDTPHGFTMTDEILADSLRILSSLLQKHYGQKVILLIDEYDVPLDKAQQSGYYDEMSGLIRNLLSRVLKGNSSLYFAVLTGCLRVAKESIFTGLNNLQVMSITDARYSEYFGFTDREVLALLGYYGLGGQFDLVKTWYDGYCFGGTDVYCPWDVVNYCVSLRADPDAAPKAFWANTSGNDIIRNFLQKARQNTRLEIEQLIDGRIIAKEINQELTYRDLYKSIDNLWSVLFTTGYLTQRGKQKGDTYQLAIPNLEIRQIFIKQVQEWFREETQKDAPKLDAFCDAFPRTDEETVEELFNAYLLKTISIRDTGVRKYKKENFYHSILLGLLSHREDWLIDSNAESGDGFSDILIEIPEKSIGIVIEVKYPESGNLEAGCKEALEQIEEKRYEGKLLQDGMGTVIKYGIACSRKRCKVRAVGNGQYRFGLPNFMEQSVLFFPVSC